MASVTLQMGKRGLPWSGDTTGAKDQPELGPLSSPLHRKVPKSLGLCSDPCPSLEGGQVQNTGKSLGEPGARFGGGNKKSHVDPLG